MARTARKKTMKYSDLTLKQRQQLLDDVRVNGGFYCDVDNLKVERFESIIGTLDDKIICKTENSNVLLNHWEIYDQYQDALTELVEFCTEFPGEERYLKKKKIIEAFGDA